MSDIIVSMTRNMLSKFIEKGDDFHQWFSDNKADFNTILYVRVVKQGNKYFIEVKVQFDIKVDTFIIDISKEDFQYILEEKL